MRQSSAEVALTVEFKRHMRYVPHRHCPKRCSEHGACVANANVASKVDSVGNSAVRASSFSCICDPFYSGEACEISTSPTCYNNCSGRGKCVDGFCVCASPFFGPACAYSPTVEPMPPSRRRFRLHVYDLDPLVLRRATYGSDPDPIFNTYHTFMQHLLADSASLTASPDDADLLLVPAFGTNMDKLIEYYEHAYEQISTSFPQLWAKHGGADHVWFSSADGGGCDLFNAHALPHLQRSLVLAHYLKLNASDGKCGTPERSVAVPPNVPPVATASFLATGETPMAQRRLDFFFAGNVPDAHLVDETSDDALAREAYSEGVRHLIWKHHRTRSNYRVVSRSRSYMQDWGASKFCLAPLGVGWGVRLIWSIVGGCIPVLASTEVAPFFDNAINYGSMALRGIPKATLPSLHHTLSSIPIASLERMHSSLLAHRLLFLWDSPSGGFAYNVTMHELCVRAPSQRRTGSCASLLPRAAASLVLPAASRAGATRPRGQARVRGTHGGTTMRKRPARVANVG